MKPLSFMIVAGETSGDLLGAELVAALKDELAKAQSRYSPDLQPLETSLVPRFFGAGGPRMRAAGVEVRVDMTEHAVIGPSDALRKISQLRGGLRRLCRLAIDREPDAVICIDFSGINLRLGSAIASYVRRRIRKPFYNWKPCMVQYVSPQVWASRPQRAKGIERDFDLLLSIFPFEKDWYALRAPRLRVEYVGHPVVDRYARLPALPAQPVNDSPVVALLPGSRSKELQRHLPILRDAAHEMARGRSVQFRMPLPTDPLAEMARRLDWPNGTEIFVSGVAETLRQATIALACTGTVTMECAWFGVPTIAFYKTSWLTYEIGKRVITVGYLAMPNVLAGHEVFPEFIQHNATGQNVARAALSLLNDEARRASIRERLRKIVGSLGPPGSARRAARAIAQLVH
jgi:lipid-A-disaccharide synthase